MATAAVALVLLGAAGLAAAGPGEPFQAILDAIAALQGDVDALQTGVDELAAKSDRLEVEAAVDLGYCATGGVQCSGHGYAAASSSNHNPIRVAVLVTLNGAGVTGLGDSDIDFSDSFVPAGGTAAVECSSTDCGSSNFQTDAAGLYVFFVHQYPPSGNNWKAGHYFATVTVTDSAGHTDKAIVDWEIA
jgi:hypothetical protein